MLCVIGAPLVVAVCVALAAVAGDPGMGAGAAPVVPAGIGAAPGPGGPFTAALPHPVAEGAGAPVLVAAPGCAGCRLGGLLALAGTAVPAAPVIVGVRLAAEAAGGTLPEMCRAALRAAA